MFILACTNDVEISLLCPSQGDTVEIGTPDFEDDKEFKRTEGAMTVCQFSPESQWNCWTVVALVIHLGNIEFGGRV